MHSQRLSPSDGGFRTAFSRRFTGTLLGSLFALAFVLSPYWLFIHPAPLALAVRIGTLGLGVLWLLASARGVKPMGAPQIRLFVLLLLAAVVINASPLRSVIAWKGDESHLIDRTLGVAGNLHPSLGVLLPLLVCGTLLAAARAPARVFAALLLLDAVLLVPFWSGAIWRDPSLGRYPFFNYWLLTPAPLLAKWLWDPYHEFLYRLVPFLSAALLAWVVSRRLSGRGLLWQSLWGLAILTIPSVLYYSSILYLEMPAVLLMTVAALGAGDWVSSTPGDVKSTTTWIAMLALGFIKETVLIFQLCFLAVRAVVQFGPRLRRESGEPPVPGFTHLKQEALVAFSVLLPLAMYGLFRAFAPTTRSLGVDLRRLLDISNYAIMARSFVEQFGVFLLLLLFGLVLLVRRRKIATVGILCAVLVATPLFFCIDAPFGNLVGYSRYNLLVVPIILAAAIPAINWISSLRWPVILCIPLAVIATNIAMSPLNRDGTKVPDWGVYLVPTAEDYYPYDEALRYLRNEHPADGILLAGAPYPFPLDFYTAKYSWPSNPRFRVLASDPLATEVDELGAALDELRRDDADYLLWRAREAAGPPPSTALHACLVKTFTNDAHQLWLFSLQVPCVDE